MADEFDDELYNVYQRAEADSNENVDIYKDSFQEENFDQSNVAASNDQNRAKGDQGSGESDQDTSTAVTAPESASSNVDQSASSMNEQQTIYQQQQQQQQQPMPFQQAAPFSPQQAQAMMAAWAQFQANPYQLAAYQRALQQMGNPFQYQQMMMRQAMMQQQQQQQPQHYSSDGDMGGAKRSGTVSVASAANQDEGKMFIGGLNWETTDESLREYFSKFGEVTDCVVMRDPTTGRSRGFAFLTMADASVIDTIVSQEHHLDGKRIDPKRAIPREEQDKTEKIFVGGISQEVNEEEFREYFMQFGKVIDATLMTDRESGRPRGFGFITFENSDGVEEALRHPRLEIKGKPVEVKKAMPKSRQMRQAAMNQMAGGMGRGYMPNARYPVAAPYGMPAAGGAGRGYGFGNGMFNNMYGNFGAFNMNPFYGRTGSGQEYDSGSNTQAGDEAGGSGHNYESEERHEKEYRNDERGSNRDRYDKDYDHERSSRREYSRHGSSRHRESSRHESSRHGSSRHESSRHESSRYDERRHRRDSRDRDYDYDSGRSGSSGSGGGGAIHASQSSRSQNNYRPY